MFSRKIIQVHFIQPIMTDYKCIFEVHGESNPTQILFYLFLRCPVWLLGHVEWRICVPSIPEQVFCATTEFDVLQPLPFAF